jgi:hypothetical protein
MSLCISFITIIHLSTNIYLFIFFTKTQNDFHFIIDYAVKCPRDMYTGIYQSICSGRTFSRTISTFLGEKTSVTCMCASTSRIACILLIAYFISRISFYPLVSGKLLQRDEIILTASTRCAKSFPMQTQTIPLSHVSTHTCPIQLSCGLTIPAFS